MNSTTFTRTLYTSPETRTEAASNSCVGQDIEIHRRFAGTVLFEIMGIQKLCFGSVVVVVNAS
jgi:hypothetical protein